MTIRTEVSINGDFSDNSPTKHEGPLCPTHGAVTYMQKGIEINMTDHSTLVSGGHVAISIEENKEIRVWGAREVGLGSNGKVLMARMDPESTIFIGINGPYAQVKLSHTGEI